MNGAVGLSRNSCTRYGRSTCSTAVTGFASSRRTYAAVTSTATLVALGHSQFGGSARRSTTPPPTTPVW